MWKLGSKRPSNSLNHYFIGDKSRLIELNGIQICNQKHGDPEF